MAKLNNHQGVHSIGNGKICAYIRGADIFDIMGPYYSTPPLVELLCNSEGKTETRRVPGSAVWDYTLEGYGSWRDFTTPESPALIRKVEASKQISWHIHSLNINPLLKAPQNLLKGTRFTKGWYGSVPAGTFFYTCQRDKTGNPVRGYPITERLFVLIVLAGDGEEKCFSDDDITFSIAKGEIAIICAANEDSGWKIFEEISASDSTAICNQTLDYWKKFTASRLVHFNKWYPGINEEYALAADDIAVLLKTQQDNSGGILAGCNYHLSYVRDNYGCFRGLMSLGCLDEAKSLLRYYGQTYKHYGQVSTAQGMGTYAFHVHEHDFAENTGYLVLMSMEYHQLTKDGGFLKELAPLIRWALAEQQKHLCNAMLPFSGDETYIAGGILPRVNIQDGSMEATLLYHRCLELFLPAAQAAGIEDKTFLKEQQAAMETVAASFGKNFIEGQILYCNKPGLYGNDNAPQRRWGVMECGHGFGVSYRTPNGRYVCIDCIGKGEDLPVVPPKRYEIISTACMPLWVHSDLVPDSILEAMVTGICQAWKKTRRLPSRPDGDLTVGYDYGLTLYAMKRCAPQDNEAFDSLRKAMLAVRDSAGAWVEYYKSGVPSGTPCRPWESAVNIAALLSTFTTQPPLNGQE